MADVLPVELQDYGLMRTLSTFLTPRARGKQCSQQPTRITIYPCPEDQRLQLRWEAIQQAENRWIPWKKAAELGDRMLLAAVAVMHIIQSLSFSFYLFVWY
jgi:hypothetical protein